MRNLLASLMLVVASVNCFAGNYTCTGKVDSINQPYNGDVIISSVSLYGNAGGRTICNLQQPYTNINTVGAETCKAWLAKLLSAQARQANLTVQYNDNLAQSCGGQPWWNAAAVPWSLWEG